MFNVNRSMSFASNTSSFHNRSLTRSSLVSESLHDPELAFDEKSPLEQFGAAKDQINSIFREISEFVTDISAFDSDLKNYSTFSNALANKELQSFTTKLSAIRDILKRDKMKVAFFGRTSSGKSTLINAMLASEILPSGIGHTTNCFIQVENSDTDDSYLCIGDTKDKRNIETVSQLGNALCDGKLSENEKATIYWSKNRCPLLSHDVVFIDSPGIDGFDNLDDFIVKYCLDADVFVLVSNVEAVLSISERNFFNKVSAKISKPNIFLLYNKWDYSDSVPEYREKLRQQHLDGSILFLSKKLNITTEAEAIDRTFFISAKEALLTRIQSSSETLPPLTSDSYQKRYFEFQHFEKKFEECISKSAIQTKFGEHLKCGKQMIQYILRYVENLLKEVQLVKVTKLKDLDELSTQLCIIEEDLMKGQKEIKDQIQNTTESVEQRVTQALNDEIRRLKNILDEFAIPFSAEPGQLPHYVCELSQHVKRSLDENLKSKLMKSVMEKIQKSQIDIKNRVLSSVPKQFYEVEYENYNKRTEEEHEFEIKYYFNVVQLSAGFSANLDFRFRWSIHSIFQKYAAQAFSIMFGVRAENSNGSPNQMSAIGSQPLVSQESFPILLKTALLSFGPESSLVVLGLLMKSVGWRVIFFGSVAYGSLYAYERMKWTTKAKSKVFQDQYISFISNRLKLVMNETSSDCSHQVMQKLSSTFIAMCKIVHNSMNSMHNKRYEVEARIKEATEMAEKCKILRNKAVYLSKQLDEFEETFL